MKCIVFVDSINNRLEYTFDFIFKLRGIDYELTTDEKEYSDSKSKKLNYSSKELSGNQIVPSSILFEEEIKQYQLENAIFGNSECLSLNGIADPIASIFYTISRYEEYVSDKKDEHGRFPFSESYLNLYGWIEKCICDRLSLEILERFDVSAAISNPPAQLIPTFDIDNTYAYKLKTGSFKFLSNCKDLLQFNFERIKERRAVHKGEKDPYDTFELIRDIGVKNKETKLFWLIGKRAEKDRNISIDDHEHQTLITSLDRDLEVNLHPSYNSNSDTYKIENEKLTLERVLDREIIRSRQHFLRFQLPKTYNSLVSAGFHHEYSMGFAEHVGFRSGTARSFYWFDLIENKKTNLIVHPFAYMDGTLNEYMKLSIEESKSKIQELYIEVCRYGGDFIFIWHNETIGDYKKWKGWSDVLHFTLNLKDE